MDTQSNSPISPSCENLVSIIVDTRESDRFVEIFGSLGASATKSLLLVGDFICSSNLIVERKTRADFEQSIIDGRLFSQIPNLLENYPRVAIIVEGVSDVNRVSKNSLLGTYATLVSDFGISLFFTKDLDSTAELVFHFAKHEQVSKKNPMRIYAKKKSLTPSALSRSIVESLPSVGPKLAKKLLEHFGSVERIFMASEDEFTKLDGLGEKKAKLIFNSIRYLYNKDEDSSI